MGLGLGMEPGDRKKPQRSLKSGAAWGPGGWPVLAAMVSVAPETLRVKDARSVMSRQTVEVLRPEAQPDLKAVPGMWG